MNFRLSRALSPILLSKMTDFSTKNITFFAVKTFWAVPDTLQCYQLDHRTSADPGGCLTQKFGVELSMGLEPLCTDVLGILFSSMYLQPLYVEKEQFTRHNYTVINKVRVPMK